MWVRALRASFLSRLCGAILGPSDCEDRGGGRGGGDRPVPESEVPRRRDEQRPAAGPELGEEVCRPGEYVRPVVRQGGEAEGAEDDLRLVAGAGDAVVALDGEVPGGHDI